jgi:ribosomal protein L37E
MANCERCGKKLPKTRLFQATCSSCGAKHKAIRNKKLSWLSALYGALAFVLIPLGLFVPGPFWVKIIVMPMLYVAGGIGVAVITQQWRVVNDL